MGGGVPQCNFAKCSKKKKKKLHEIKKILVRGYDSQGLPLDPPMFDLQHRFHNFMQKLEKTLCCPICDAPVTFCFMQHRKKVNSLGNKAFQPKFLALLEIHEVESASFS